MKKISNFFVILLVGSLVISLPAAAKKGEDKPSGWEKGKKVGWDGGELPPGLSKKEAEKEAKKKAKDAEKAGKEKSQKNKEKAKSDAVKAAEVAQKKVKEAEVRVQQKTVKAKKPIKKLTIPKADSAL